MGYSKQIVDQVKEDFADKRQKAIRAAEERKLEMYDQAPMLREIDTALSSTGLKIYRATLMGEKGIDKRIAALKKENLELQDDRKRILAACGKPVDYLDVKYECKICNDTGFDGLSMCSCFKKALIKARYNSSGLGAVLTKQNFDNFDLTYYSDVKDADGTCPREHMTSILESAKKFVKQFGTKEKVANLLFVGKTGLGKTHLSTAIAKAVIDKGGDVVYDTIQNIIHNYERETFARSDEAAQAISRYTEAELLIIDDLGTEFKSNFTTSVLYNLLNSRIIAELPMIINTNLDESDLFKKQYDDRIISRLIGNFRTFRFSGRDIRIQKTMERSAEK